MALCGIVAVLNAQMVNAILELRADELPGSIGLEVWNLKQPKISVSATIISPGTAYVSCTHYGYIWVYVYGGEALLFKMLPQIFWNLTMAASCLFFHDFVNPPLAFEIQIQCSLAILSLHTSYAKQQGAQESVHLFLFNDIQRFPNKETSKHSKEFEVLSYFFLRSRVAKSPTWQGSVPCPFCLVLLPLAVTELSDNNQSLQLPHPAVQTPSCG